MKTTTLSPWLTLAVLWPWWAWKQWRHSRAVARAKKEAAAHAELEKVSQKMVGSELRQGRSPWDERWGSRRGDGFYDDES